MKIPSGSDGFETETKRMTLLEKIVVAVAALVVMGICNQYQVDGFQCYRCSSNELKVCLEEPEELPRSNAVPCEGFCTIVRTEYTDIPGEAITLLRDCVEEEPLVPNGVRTENHYTKMYTSCDTELCNSGNGTRNPGEDNARGGPGNIIIVPESSSTAI